MAKEPVKFPEKGLDKAQLIEQLKASRQSDARWKAGRTWSLVFYPGDEVAEVLEEAYRQFMFENGLNPTAFPSLRKFESEVVAMAIDLLGGGPEAVGNMTTGGTESILLAVKAAREWAKVNRPEVKEPEIVLPVTAHPAFEKAAHYFGLKTVHAPLRSDFRVDVEQMANLISANTIMLVGSAPAYPHGVVDPVSDIAALALEKGILCHVDACVGGFMLPFVRELGYPVPPFDLSVKGVTSISADLHKYGYALKGASVILYANKDIRKYQYFIHTDWPGGIYASPTISGTRSGGAIAAAWAVLKYLGREKYLEMARAVMEARERLIRGINEIPGLKVISNPEMSVFAFTSDRYDVFAIADELGLMGWQIDRQQFPDSLHMTVTWNNVHVVDEFLHDLFKAVARVRKLNWHKVKSSVSVSVVKGIAKVLPEKAVSKLTDVYSTLVGTKSDTGLPARSAAMYGMMAALPNRGDIKQMIINLLDNINEAR